MCVQVLPVKSLNKVYELTYPFSTRTRFASQPGRSFWSLKMEKNIIDQYSVVLPDSPLWWRANAQYISTWLSLRWPIYLINSVHKAKHSFLIIMAEHVSSGEHHRQTVRSTAWEKRNQIKMRWRYVITVVRLAWCGRGLPKPKMPVKSALYY